MALWTVLILLVLALCTIAVVGTLLASQRVKADYSEATYFAEQFAEAIGKIMPELSGEQKEQVLRATEHIDDGKLARRMSEKVWEWKGSHPGYHFFLNLLGYFRHKDNTREADVRGHDLRLFTAMKPYIFALSYFDHLLGSEVRRFCAEDAEDPVKRLTAWIFAKTKGSSPSAYWSSQKSEISST